MPRPSFFESIQKHLAREGQMVPSYNIPIHSGQLVAKLLNTR